MLARATSGPKGTTAQHTSAGMMVMMGPRKNRPLLDAEGDDLPKISFTASAMGCNRPAGPDAVRGPDGSATSRWPCVPTGSGKPRSHQQGRIDRDDLDQAPDHGPEGAEVLGTELKMVSIMGSPDQAFSTRMAPKWLPAPVPAGRRLTHTRCQRPVSLQHRGHHRASPWLTRTWSRPSGPARPTGHVGAHRRHGVGGLLQRRRRARTSASVP